MSYLKEDPEGASLASDYGFCYHNAKWRYIEMTGSWLERNPVIAEFHERTDNLKFSIELNHISDHRRSQCNQKEENIPVLSI